MLQLSESDETDCCDRCLMTTQSPRSALLPQAIALWFRRILVNSRWPLSVTQWAPGSHWSVIVSCNWYKCLCQCLWEMCTAAHIIDVGIAACYIGLYMWICRCAIDHINAGYVQLTLMEESAKKYCSTFRTLKWLICGGVVLVSLSMRGTDRQRLWVFLLYPSTHPTPPIHNCYSFVIIVIMFLLRSGELL